MEALVSSCVVLPCTFNYPISQLPESRLKGIWHKQTDINDRIYDEDNTLISDSFKGRTKLIGKLGEKNCTLEINSVKNHDNGPFCFRAEIPKYDKFSFVEKCVTIKMKAEPAKPILDHEENFVEDSIATFRCYVRHTCPTHHPTIKWSRSDAKPLLSYKDNGHGVWEVESLLTFPATKEDNHEEITCSVTFHGNMQSEVTHKIYIKRSINKARITPDSTTEFLEGVEQDITCSVTYMCSSDQPGIVWNNGQLVGITSYRIIQGTEYEAKSTLKFTAKADDHGRNIVCQINFKGTARKVTITLRVKRSMGSLDWSFTMPSAIAGTQGSCVVIPCNFKFKNSRHISTDVKWYRFSPSDYSLVYNKYESINNINNKFRGKTSLYGSSNDNNCSLKIQPLEMEHNQERLFPWLDKSPIENLYIQNFKDETIALEVTDSVEKPQAELLGIAKVGEPVTLSCSVIHTCPPIPPKLSWSISRGTRKFINTPLYNGKWKTTMEITWTVEEDDTSVTCSVSYLGGQTSKTEISLNPLCPIDQVQITPNANTEFLEGVEQDIVCSVTYMCAKDRPYLSWSSEQLPGSMIQITKHGKKQVARSTLKFTPKTGDHGKTITCQADFRGNIQTVEITLKVQSK
ncbi:Myelin-associated glycoprotein [Bagarius yarrelli]|uniref:Myelin-associated glycoprotein n=1 Tax=Bagarius yarrelli TaxID=175774 RepID=A0A556U5Y2_BAGYA|nr:Myelin-associated glycoprotein [Bagarius yarrelli]